MAHQPNAQLEMALKEKQAFTIGSYNYFLIANDIYD
jgi:hypothetical protein